MISGVDYSRSRPDPVKLYTVGVRFVMRYLSWLPNTKVVTAPEVAALRKAGLAVGLNWEYDSHDMQHGGAYGHIQATEAVRQARLLGYPQGCTIYYSADYNASAGDVNGPFVNYLNAVRAVHGNYYGVGVYGGLNTIQTLLNGRPWLKAWQTYAWSHGVWDSRAVMRQTQNAVPLASGTVDRDVATESLTAAGLWTIEPAKTPPAVPPSHVPGSRELSRRTPMMIGADVLYVQHFIGASHCGIADGKFGDDTKAGVKWYQGDVRGITADGIVGPITWKEMGIHPTF